jgi:hypothetical protein
VLNVDLHFTPFLSLANVIGEENIKVKSWDVIRIPAAQQESIVHNKLLLYKQVLKPIWTYGIQLWGCAATSNINQIQVFQNKVLRGIVHVPWYYRNNHLHRDLKIPTIR